MSKKGNPIIYIGGPGYSYEDFEPLIGSLDEHIKEVLSVLKSENYQGVASNIRMVVDVFNPEKVGAFAKTVDIGNGTYVTAHFAPFFTYPISRDRLTPSDH
ncbi:hypothetical protein FT643_20140 [Ketobacter sp. MCCC 1A13808]|uniref:hypothetical protein n=1 Tax=Ketobacter sp. MCCC 1A13808 TaxID=2602738 RepID=UPI0012ECB455|nr:hypothetical protein [Ketobacter sp. MCCC 1A13808]MVF14451.1 hypothetical protein [Ketobacter sp. MCCC 1A13808]